jgi:hypothetical protein
LLLAGVGLLVPGLSRATAGEVEVRDFAITVDGKASGDYHMTITHQDDGTTTLDARSEVTVKFLLITAYSYSYHAQEVWKNGRLQGFASNGKENSKVFSISAQAQGDALQVKANGQDRTLRGDSWTTSCWNLPAPSFRNGPVPLMGCDTGDQINGQMQFIGQEQITVAGQEMTCSHYRVMRPVPHDIWYDSSERMVRDVWMSDGHRTEVNLTGLRR